MSLGNVVLSEISQTQKQPDIIHLDQVCSPVIPFLPHSTKKNKTKQKCSDENRSVVVRGWDHGKVFLPKPMRECFRAKETFLSILCFQINLLKSSHLVLFKKRLNFVCTKISISYVFRKIIFIVITEMLLQTKVKVKVTQFCPTLCDPEDYAVHGILQAGVLEWVAFRFFRLSSQPRDQTQVSHIAAGVFTKLNYQGNQCRAMYS